MKILFLIVALVSISLVSKVNAFRCFASVPSVGYENSRAVFIGELVKKEPLDSEFSGHLGLMRYRLTFNVEYSWKGAGFREIGLHGLVVISDEVIKAPEGLEDCFPFMSFVEGKKYLVYATETLDKKLTVGQGNGSKPLWDASNDLKELRQMEAFFQFRARQ